MAHDDPKSLSLLGKAQSSFPERPEQEILETFANKSPQRDYWIELNYPEFSSLCPVTGQPDTAHLTIRYRPGDLCVETKSLKFYLVSYRNHRSFNEEVINQIADHLINVCQPKQMEVTGRFSARGGISLTVKIEHPPRA
ncbi:MAG: preQ(1) synthase [Verrucomicrobiota bacterium]